MSAMQQSFDPSSMMIEPAFASTASLWPSSFLLGIASFDYHGTCGGVADGSGDAIASFDYHGTCGVADGSGATMFSLKRKTSDEEDLGKLQITTMHKIARSLLSSDAATTARQTIRRRPRSSSPADLKEAAKEEVGVGFHAIVNAPPEEADRIRSRELQRVLSHKKLHLVLDIDHTLLNSAVLANVSPVEEDYLHSLLLRQNYQSGGEAGAHLDGGLHRLERLRIWTKLRPFVRQFLSAASEMYEMCVYTMGNRPYADAMARLLDPNGSLFGGRIISRSESRCPRSKDLDVTYLSDTATVILDDTPQVWPRHKPNVVVMERYHFFQSSSRSFTGSKASISSMSELRTDESERDGALSDALSLLRQVHAAYFHGEYVDANGRRRKYGQDQDSINIIHGKDVREILREMRKSVLSGCKIVFSRLFPTNSSHPNTHRYWKLSEDLGAKCATEVDETVTHVVALDAGTDKARWAIREGRHLVHPRWIDVAFFCRKRQDESCFSVFNPHSMKTTPHFTKIVGVHAQSPAAQSPQANGKVRGEIHRSILPPSDFAYRDRLLHDHDCRLQNSWICSY